MLLRKQNQYKFQLGRIHNIKMSDDLSNRGIYFDDIYVLRVLDPEITTETNDLKSESTEYTESEYYYSSSCKVVFDYD